MTLAAAIMLSAGISGTGDWRGRGAGVSVGWLSTVVGGSGEKCRNCSSCPATAAATPETDSPVGEEDAISVLKWKRAVRAGYRMDSNARARIKR